MNKEMIGIILKSTWSSGIFNKKKNTGILLDPINTAFAIALLNFYPDGTKISIQNNEIYFQEPWTLQGISRWKNGDKYEDIHNLINPIKKLIASKKNQSLWSDDSFKYICLKMKSGLERLAKTYRENLIANHTIEFYQSLITENLQNKSHFLDKLDTEPDELGGTETFDIYKSFFGDWEFQQIDLVISILKNLETETKDEITKAYKDSIHLIMTAHNQRIKRIIDQVKSGAV